MAEAATIGRALAHDSASRHVTGEAVYVDDMPEPARCLEIYIAWAQCARPDQELDLAAVRAAPGVVAVLTNDDIRASTTSARSAATTSRFSPPASSSTGAMRSSP